MAKLITRTTRAQTIRERWSEHYRHLRSQGSTHPINVIGRNLDELELPINPDDVDRIVGNKSWTEVPACDECGKSASALVELGIGVEGSTACAVCLPCLKQAVVLIKAVQGSQN